MSDTRRRATFVAPANIAFIKYWGIRDENKVIPYNSSISMTLSRCTSKCTVEFDSARGADEIWFRQVGGDFEPAADAFARPVRRHLETLRSRAGVGGGCRVWTENSFPTGAGIASSASGFSALTLAASEAMGAPPKNAAEASVLARMSGSGSAARSVLGGYVLWPESLDDSGGSSEQAEQAAVQIATAAHWDLRDVVAVVDSAPKAVSSRDGHRRAPSSPRFAPRLEELGARLLAVRDAIQRRDIEALGKTLETEAIDLHQVAMSSRPPIYYWKPGTLAVLWSIRSLRAEGVPVYATIDAGPNVHAICPAEFEERVAEAFGSMKEVESVLLDRVGTGPYETSDHFEGPAA
ncbi:MAG: diphosphomevalonate decarboxylase [Acidobacteria bacterium]|nr:diphosphomevalonate decarboxylase [Acidobacteriota bacterium]